MSKRPSWVWTVYFLLYLFFMTANTVYFFDRRSMMSFFYHFLIAYDTRYLIPYTLNAASIIFNAISLLPFYLYLRNGEFLSKPFWRGIFIARLFFDITGRLFEFKFYKSLFYQDTLLGLSAAFLALSFHIPSYIAFYLYAFRRSPSPQDQTH